MAQINYSHCNLIRRPNTIKSCPIPPLTYRVIFHGEYRFQSYEGKSMHNQYIDFIIRTTEIDFMWRIWTWLRFLLIIYNILGNIKNLGKIYNFESIKFINFLETELILNFHI
jgi:hypothetical protein